MNSDGDRVIAILTDRTFCIRNVAVVIDHVNSIISKNRDAIYIYGMNERVDSHVEYFARTYALPKDALNKFEYDATSPLAISKEFFSLLRYNIDELHLFTDYPNSDTASLITRCKEAAIPVTIINSSPDIIYDAKSNGSVTYYKRGV